MAGTHLDEQGAEIMCRICHVPDEENSIPMELGCNCRGDLSRAHIQCADKWFRIRKRPYGMCELCGVEARNWLDHLVKPPSTTTSEIFERFQKNLWRQFLVFALVFSIIILVVPLLM